MIRSHVLICGGTGCSSSGSVKLSEKLAEELKAKGLDEEIKPKGNLDGAVKALNEEINGLHMMLKCAENTSNERGKLLEDSQKQLADAIDHIEKLHVELEELEKAKLVNENALKRTVQLLKEENDELKKTSAAYSPAEVIALRTERDLYKAQYEMMFERLIGA